MSTNLLDWRDYPFIIWVISQDINHIVTLDFGNFFETNAFYPHKLTLLFTDILLPQALMYMPFFYLTGNPILSLNIIFVLTFILNFATSYLLWRFIFKKEILAFLGSMFFIFSPFFHMELSHFQMMFYWPFILTLYLLFKSEGKNNRWYQVIIGLLISVQFLASVYLSVYLLFSVVTFYLVDLFYRTNKQSLIKPSIILFIFLLTSGIFIKGYSDMKNTYNIKRDIKEYITYSANLSDYIFTTVISSTIHRSEIIQFWNKTDKNQGTHASFPGFLIFFLSVIAIFQLSKNRHFLTLSVKLDKQKAFFLILILIGFLFSLGPRIKFNGNYAHIPLPYSLALKFVPLIEATRVPSRWDFIFYLGLVYFSLITLSKLPQKFSNSFVYAFIILIFCLEYIPTNIQSVKDTYINKDYEFLKDACSKNKKVLLELPMTHLDAYPNIIEGLRYIAVAELSSTYHNCYLVNGYSGYDLPENFELGNLLKDYIVNQDIKNFLAELRNRNIDYVRFNRYYFLEELKPSTNIFVDSIATTSGIQKISDDLFQVNRE